jgi:MraZ protein
MSLFLGTHLNRLDAKGRVSVPAPFRTALRAAANCDDPAINPTLVLRPSHTAACIDVLPWAAFQALATPLDQLDVFSPEHDDLATTIYADAYPMEADKEGRIILPEPLVSHAGLTGAVAFVGKGRIFQIWEPAAAARESEAARERTRLRKMTLGQAA